MHNVRLVLVLFPGHWLKNCDEIFKRGNRNRVITFDSHLKTTLSVNLYLLDINWSVGVLSSKSFYPRLHGEAFFYALLNIFSIDDRTSVKKELLEKTHRTIAAILEL